MPAPSTPYVSVVMPTYNRRDRLAEVLEPLLADAAASEIVVVVDGCTDGSLELLEEMARLDARLRPLFIENSGDMGARDAGARAASGEVLLFLDDDVLAGESLVGGHARHHADGGRRLVLGYMPIALGEQRLPAEFATRLYAAEYEGRCEVYERDRTSVLRELWGGNFSMRRADCLAVGMRNPSFIEHYHADRDFGLRCHEAGIEGVFDRDLRGLHLHERTLPSFVRDARSQGAGRVLVHRLHADTLGPLPAESFETGLPGPLRALVAAARRRRIWSAGSGALSLLVRAAGAARAWPVQDAAARLLRRMAQQRGAVEMARRLRERPL